MLGSGLWLLLSMPCCAHALRCRQKRTSTQTASWTLPPCRSTKSRCWERLVVAAGGGCRHCCCWCCLLAVDVWSCIFQKQKAAGSCCSGGDCWLLPRQDAATGRPAAAAPSKLAAPTCSPVPLSFAMNACAGRGCAGDWHAGFGVQPHGRVDARGGGGGPRGARACWGRGGGDMQVWRAPAGRVWERDNGPGGSCLKGHDKRLQT